MNLKHYFGSVLLVISSLLGKAQQSYELTKINEFYSILTMDVLVANPINTINIDGLTYTSLKIEVKQPVATQVVIGFKNPQGLINYLSTKISDHADEGFDGTFSSSLQVFETPQTSLNLNFGNFKGYVKIKLFYALPIKNSTIQKLYKADNRCDKPQMISDTIWRKGLPDPKPPREATDVEHLVVHHSAGNNSDTNYINIVRNIYLLHTQSNGWDDIGYNFLVAPNGVIFNGRDPQGAGDDDNILGAHFCGKNQNTMGVCMMGDFMSVKPTDKAIFSLKYLLAWKLKKDSINAFGQTKHPRETGSLLNNICGHRDGCNTDCPGDLLYAMLPSIKTEAARIADSCGLVLSDNIFFNKKEINVFPNPSKGTITIAYPISVSVSQLIIYETNGKLVYQTDFISNQPIELPLPSGLYFYKIFDKTDLISQNLLSIQH